MDYIENPVDVWVTDNNNICIALSEESVYITKDEARKLIAELRELVETTAFTKHLEQV